MRQGDHASPVKPKGYRKSKSRLKAKRSPVYVPPTTEKKRIAAKWLRK